MSRWERLFFWGVLALATALLLTRLGAPSLIDPDEARFARTSVEMMESGDLVVPTFRGEPRLVKPPLLHWAQMLSFMAMGVSELAARLPSTLATLASLLVLVWVARRRFGYEGASWAAAIFMTSPLVLAMARSGTTDALLAVHVFAALALDMAEPDETGPHKGAAMGALLGLAFLAKGPVGIVLAILMILAGRTAAGKNVLPRLSTTAAFVGGWALVALPWGLAFLDRVSGGETLGVLRQEVMERYFAGTDHVQPPWYYLIVMLIGFVPWIGPLALATVRVIAERQSPAARTALYAGAAMVAGLIFFSIGRGKLPHYVLPLAPLVALLVTWELGQELRAPRERRLGPFLLTTTLWLMAIGLGAYAAILDEPFVFATATAGTVSFGVGGLIAVAGLIRQRPREVYAAGVVATTGLMLGAVLSLHPGYGQRNSTSLLIERVPELQSGRAIVVVDIDLPSLVFYLDRLHEKTWMGGLSERLDRGDDPLVIVADHELETMPADLKERLEEIGRHRKLHVFDPQNETEAKEPA